MVLSLETGEESFKLLTSFEEFKTLFDLCAVSGRGSVGNMGYYRVYCKVLKVHLHYNMSGQIVYFLSLIKH